MLDFDNYRTDAAQEAQAQARAEGKIPLLHPEMKVVEAMAARLLEHPVASALFVPGSGEPEQSLFWPDPETGVWRRARPDWLPHNASGRMILPDYKTAKSASREAINKSLDEYGYARQAAWYLDGIFALGLNSRPAFVLVVQEKTPPYV